MSSGYPVNDEQAAVFLAALILDNAKLLNGKPLRVSADSIREAMKASGIKARDVFGDGNDYEDYEVEFKLLN